MFKFIIYINISNEIEISIIDCFQLVFLILNKQLFYEFVY